MCVVDQDQMNAPGFVEGNLYAAGCNWTFSFWLQWVQSFKCSLMIYNEFVPNS
jgi:hypothetical protein